jgi:hypothetical protein
VVSKGWLLFEVEHVKLNMIFTNLSLVLLGFASTSQPGYKTYSYIFFVKLLSMSVWGTFISTSIELA